MHRFLILALPLLAAGCLGPEIPEEELPITVLAQGQQSLQTETRFEWITDPDGFESLWETTQTGARPSVDFERDGVIAVFLGEQPTGGHSIRVDRAVLGDDELMVEVVLQSPGPECITTQALTRPYQMVSVPQVAEQATFTTRSVLVPCT